MATGDDLDPARMNAIAQENLRKTMDTLSEHIDALTKPTMALALAAAKRANEGAEELEPAALTRRFVSKATAPGIGEPHEPGELNRDRSDASAMPQRGTWEKFLGMSTGAPGAPPSSMAQAREAIAGEGAGLAGEDIKIPQFGDWRIDSLLKLGAQVSGKFAVQGFKGIGGVGAIRGYASQAKEEVAATGTALTPQEWASQSGVGQTLGGLSNTLATGAHIAATASLLHKKVLGPAADIGFGASNVGAGLGFSPQSEGLGVFGASHVLGIPNPIAAFTSPAGKQGMGMFSNAFQASVLGTGIGFGEANQLREALASHGWSNTREHGLLGFAEGGPNETLARSLEPLVKQGVKNPELLSEFTDALKLGTTTVEELGGSLEGLQGTAQVLNKTTEDTAASMQEFSAKAVEGGATMVHGFKSFKEIAAATGMNPNLVQGINESNFGRVQALQKGVLPWEVAGLTGNAASLNAAKTVEKVMGFVPKNLRPIEETNPVTGKKEVTETVKQQQLAWLHQLDPNITAEQAEHLLNISGKLPFITGGISAANQFEKNRLGKEAENQRQGTHMPELLQAENKWHEQHARTQRLKDEIAKTTDASKKMVLEKELEDAEGVEHGTAGNIHSLASKAKKQGGIKQGSAQEAELNRELGGEKGLFEIAYKAGVSAPEIARIHKDPLWQQGKDLRDKIEKINKVNIEAKQEENAKIELSGPAKSFFKLKFPKVSKAIEQNEGGSATSNAAANPNSATPSAQQQANERRVASAERAEPHGG